MSLRKFKSSAKSSTLRPFNARTPSLSSVLRTRHRGDASRPHADEALNSLQGVIECNPDGIAVTDAFHRLVFFNQRYLDLWGFERHQMVDMTSEARMAHQRKQLLHESDELPFCLEIENQLTVQRQVFNLKDGRWFERHAYHHVVHGKNAGLVIHWRDVSAFQEANQAAAYERELMHALMDSVPDQIFFKDTESRFIRINPSLARRYNLLDPSHAIGKSDADFYSAEHAAQTVAEEREIMRTGAPVLNQVHHELWANGAQAWNVSNKMPLLNSRGELIGTYGISRDITEQKKTETLIWQQANFDALTGLPNRRLLRDRWVQAIKNQHRTGALVGLLMIDLDHFKEVNDLLGHARGDELLVEAAQRIGSHLRSTDTVARLGGDEFAVILTNLETAADAGAIAQKMLKALAHPFSLGHENIYISGSIGITLASSACELLDDLFKQADQAMYVAKSRGRNGVSFFTPEFEAQSQNRLRTTNDLHQALLLNQFFVLYQPIVDLATGRVDKVEALLRWHHPERGLIEPSEFIPLAESSGLILKIGDWVFRQVAQQALEWRQTLPRRVQVAVNTSPLQFRNDTRSPQYWAQHLKSMGLEGGDVEIEITEGLLLGASERVQQQLLNLQKTGIQVSIDDFGTGYSSLAYLQLYSIDFIKIDQSFVSDLRETSKNMALCRSMIHMAHELGMKVVAEGVETAEQRDLLIQAGCDFGQGYLFAHPLTPLQLEDLLREPPPLPNSN